MFTAAGSKIESVIPTFPIAGTGYVGVGQRVVKSNPE
jgi:hypothetical protein